MAQKEEKISFDSSVIFTLLVTILRSQARIIANIEKRNEDEINDEISALYVHTSQNLKSIIDELFPLFRL